MFIQLSKLTIPSGLAILQVEKQLQEFVDQKSFM